ncbi:histidine phosphatase family protein [Streptacidiphilus rugosus]|uniref:histidine phosphatase family protein n=1 Tax=Streptacidiphilus rugosus TaxID=405783 RepID=UPI00056D5168|nr:histidine phosphatase family protein [Streptacidiphilus rugosus]
MNALILLRHGETAWSRNGRHTSRTDIDLTPLGEQQARAVGPLLTTRPVASVLISPLSRARRTAELAGLPNPIVEPDLHEWDYGSYEGLTTAQIQQTHANWNLFTHGAPDGENADQVAARVDRVLARIDALPPATLGGDVVLVAHGHVLRVLTARRLGLAPQAGAGFRLETAAVCSFGTEHGLPVLTGWNSRPPFQDGAQPRPVLERQG